MVTTRHTLRTLPALLPLWVTLLCAGTAAAAPALPPGQVTVDRLPQCTFASIAAADPGYATLATWGARILAHNATRPELQTAFKAEIRHLMAKEGTRPLADWLAELGARPTLNDDLVAALTPVLGRFLTADPVLGWLDLLLQPTERPARKEAP